MPTLTFNIDCTDEQVHNLLEMLLGKKSTAPPPEDSAKVPGGTAIPTSARQDVNRIATKFSEFVKAGSLGQLNAMKVWLAANGNARLIDLVQASGVKKQQDYGGVSGSLSKNMLKAGGVSARAHGLPQFPREWYGVVYDPGAQGERRYVIATELVEPLKAAFARLST
jgi:hypothetical protein